MATSRVLVTDGAMKHTLAAVRSLGKHGLQVTVVEDSLLAESFYSKYCYSRRLLRRKRGPEEYVLQLRSILKKEPHDVLLPISWYANYYISKYHHHLERLVSMALPNFESMEIAANKSHTMEYAERLGIKVPKTLVLNTVDDLHRAGDTIGYPLVIKGSTEGGTVRYAYNFKGIESAYKQLKHDRPIAQQYIDGDGVGFFAAYDQGRCVAEFMHKRIREFPSKGGPSSAAQSFYSKELAVQGKRLLDSLKWHGVAMVEFKHSRRDGLLYLMEINPKFWGSLELSIYSGMDFPYIAYNIALGNASLVAQKSYKLGVLFRWPFPGEFLHALETRNCVEFIRNSVNREYGDDIRITDPVPLLLQLISTIRKVRKRKSGR
ncbi:carboxylate--amine ligase [Candidatus Thorarchaeota archaeon]|nr:MAG: carboxylate--amine ligase [Candidatus Thorarchaeota archaeon]